MINRLSNGSTLTKGNIHDIVMSTAVDELGTANWRPELYEHLIIHRGQRGQVNFSGIFDELLEKRIIRPGFTFKCENCLASGWYHVSEFGEEYKCRFCFSPQRVNFGAKREWQFKADGLFQIENSALGSIAGIVALWRFAELQSLSDGRYLSSVKLRDRADGRDYEIDYAYLFIKNFSTAHSLVLGQAKNFIDFTEEEIRRMGELACKFGKKPYLAFSTLKDAFSERERTLLRALAARGHKVIALTRLELDPYHLYKRFEGAPHRYAHNLDDLSQNSLHLNINQAAGA